MPLRVFNSNNHPVVLRAFDGNSVQVGSRARGVTVANVFGWQIPPGVRVEEAGEDVVDPCAHVRGRMPTPLVNPPKTVEEARALHAKGMHPHQTPRERKALQEKARDLLANLPKSDTSATAMDAVKPPVKTERMSLRPGSDTSATAESKD